MEGDGIGPEITAATLAVLRAADRRFGSGLHSPPPRSGSPRCASAARRFPRRSTKPHVTPTASSSGRCRTTTIRRVARAGSIRRASCASGSTFTPISARPAAARGFPPRCGVAGRSRDRAREHRGLLRRPLHVSRAPASSCRRRTWRSSIRKITRARLDAHRGGGIRARHAAAQEGDGRAQGQRAARLGRACSSNACARWRSAIRRSSYEERIVDAMAALLVRDAARVRRHRHHQHVRRHPVRPGVRDRRQPRPRGLAQRRRRRTPWRRRSTARRPTSPARTSPIRRR